jgi:major membrane immunogen (membrane-anchored lipoprotein)
MDDDMAGSGISMMAGRNVARAAATALAAIVVLIAALQGSALAAAPELVINQPLTGSATNLQTPVFTGTTSDIVDLVTLQIYAGETVGGVPVQTLPQPVLVEISPTEASWEITPASLAPGQYTAVAEQTNSEAASGTSLPVTFTVEAAPAVTLTAPAGGAVLKTSEPNLTGAGGTAPWDGPVTVAIHEGSSLAGTVVASEGVLVSGGMWSYSPHLSDGVYTAQAVQSDELGDTGTSAAVTFTVDTIAPVVTLTSPAGGAVLKTSEPTLTGVGGTAAWDKPVTVAIHEGNSLAGPVVASEGVAVSGGAWSYSPHLSDGVYTVQAEQGDEAGNTGASAVVTFTVDANAPLVTLTSPEAGALLDSSEPTLSGSAGDASWDEPVTTVTVHQGGSLAGEVVALGDVPVSGGTWSYSVPELSDGIYTAQVAQRDEAGHMGTSMPVTFTVDTTAPVVTLTSPAQGAFVNSSTPTLSGAAGAAPWDHQHVTVAIHEGASLGGTLLALKSVTVSGGKWSYAASHLGDGTYTAQASQEDDAGHTGLSSEVTFTVDTTPPALTLVTPANGEHLDTSRPTFGGLAGQASGDQPSVTVKIYKGSTISGSPTQTLEVTPNGGEWTTGSGGPALANGTYTALAEQFDAAGNRAERTTTFTVETNSPKVTLDTSGFQKSEGYLLAGATPSFSGTGATEPQDGKVVSVKIYIGTSASGELIETVSGTLSGSVWETARVAKALPDGVYTAQAEQTDSNPFSQTGVSTAVTFTVDTQAPTVELTSPAEGAFVRSSDPTLSGSAGAGAWDKPVKVTIHEGGSLTGPVVDEESVSVSGGTWSYLPRHALSDGPYTALAEQSDEAGNKGISTPVTFTVDTHPPALTVQAPADGEALDTSRPTFSGLAGHVAGDQPLVTLKIYRGSSVSASPIQTLEVTPDGAEWTTGSSVAALSNGPYTALAEQSDKGGNRTERVVIFTVDAHPPKVTLTSPAKGSSTSSSSQTVSGAAGTEAGDLPGITVQLYAGPTIAGQAPTEAVTVQASNGGWSAVFGGLSPGTYTADAEQSDDLGNVGQSEPVTFTVLATPAVVVAAAAAPSPPIAAFKSIPSNPQTGEPVTLASSSSDGSSPITGYAWALAGNGVFTQGESTITTSFSTPGPHVVQLRVTDANGLSSTVAETIAVASASVPLMQPFPVVRMSGSFGASGAKIGLLAALAPVGSTVTITCRGRGCPAKSQAFVATSPSKSKTGSVTIVFRRFERFLRAGVVLEIRISKQGQIGKFTRFVIHRGKSPSRVDECLSPAGTTPLVCPS